MRTTRAYRYNLPLGKGVLISDGATAQMVTGIDGQILTSRGAEEEPGFEAGAATNIEGGSAGQVPYQTAPSTTGFISGAANTVLTHNGTSPSFSPSFTLSGGDNLITLSTTANANPLRLTIPSGNIGIRFDSGANSGYVFESGSNIYLQQGPHNIRLSSGGVVGVPANYLNSSYLSVNGAGDVVKNTVFPPAVNLQGGTAGQVPYQTAPSTTAFISGAANTVLTHNGTSPSFSPTLQLSGVDDTLGLTTTTNGQNPLWLKTSAGFNIGIRLRSGTNDFYLHSTNGTEISMQNGASATAAIVKVRQSGQIQISSQYANAPFLTTDGSANLAKGTVLGVANGGTGSTGPVSTTTTMSRFGGGTIVSLTYTNQNIHYEKTGDFYTVAVRFLINLTVSGGGVNLQIDMPFTASDTSVFHLYDETNVVLRVGHMKYGTSKCEILSGTGSPDTFNNGTYGFKGTFSVRSV